MAGIDTQLARDFRAAMQAQAEQDRAKNGVSIVIGQVVEVVGSTVKLQRMGNDHPDGYPSDLYYNVVGGVPAVNAWVVGLDTLGGVIVMGSGAGGGGGGVTDHGALTGLADDDHTQYHTDARGDTRYVNETDFTAAAVVGKFTGTPNGTKFLRDDGALAAGGGTTFTAGKNTNGLYVDSTAGGGAVAGKNTNGLYVEVA